MHDGGWVALLRHIPAEQQPKYMLVTNSGQEIALQSFLRIEKELVVVKGRLSGSQDQGRIFFIPYKHIDYFGTAQVTKETEFAEVFDSFSFPEPPVQAMMAAAPPEPEPEPEPEPPPARPSSLGPPPPAQTASGVRRIVRSQVLDRFRNRAPGTPPSSQGGPRPAGS